jgi:hypothetical protein
MTPASRVATAEQLIAAKLRGADFYETVLAKDQPEYLQMSVLMERGDEEVWGQTTCRYELTWRERLRVLFSGSIFISQLTFGGKYAPIRPATTLGELYDWKESE